MEETDFYLCFYKFWHLSQKNKEEEVMFGFFLLSPEFKCRFYSLISEERKIVIVLGLLGFVTGFASNHLKTWWDSSMFDSAHQITQQANVTEA